MLAGEQCIFGGRWVLGFVEEWWVWRVVSERSGLWGCGGREVQLTMV